MHTDTFRPPSNSIFIKLNGTDQNSTVERETTAKTVKMEESSQPAAATSSSLQTESFTAIGEISSVLLPKTLPHFLPIVPDIIRKSSSSRSKRELSDIAGDISELSATNKEFSLSKDFFYIAPFPAPFLRDRDF